MVLNLEKFDLNDVVSSVDAIIQPMARARKQSFHLEVSGIRHEYLVGDETRINQILINLLSNAVKYTPEGGQIWFRIIGLKQRSSQYEHIRIEVEDNGYGMTPEYLETIFDAFTRAENSTTNKVQGTGLGMAITKSIVELMGGSIEVCSEVGKGSLFRVELELRVQEDAGNQSFWASRGVTGILTVGGSDESRESILALMEGAGVKMEAAPDTETALECLRNGLECQLVLLDWEDGGLEAAKALRDALPEGVPLLLLAEADAEGLEAAFRLGGVDMLAKPFFVSAFRTKAEGLWSEETAGEEPEMDDMLNGLRFLAAEDNEINAEILTELLEQEGARCEIVENGQMAVERFRDAAPGEFDMILMDVQMPVMNGHEAARAIRKLEREDAGRIPIIAMTANAFAEDEKAALDAGMNAHVPKPLNMEHLKRIIRQLERGKDGKA